MAHPWFGPTFGSRAAIYALLGLPLACKGSTGEAPSSSGGSRSSAGAGGTGGSSAAASGGAATSGGMAHGGSAPNGGAKSTGGAAGGATARGGSPSSGGVAGALSTGGGNPLGGSAAGGGKATGGAGGNATSGGAAPLGGAGGASCGVSYDQTVLCDEPVGFWAMNVSSGTQEADLSGNGSPGSYKGPPPTLVALPNGDQAAAFNGSSNYLTIPSKAAFSIPTTGNLTWEAWIRPSVLQFPNHSGGYVDWMGKCADYSPTCEWEARLYNTDNSQNRCNRLSAYVFNPGAGLGSGADWQPTCGLFQANAWLHVVGEYTTLSQPADCADAATYPGAIEIWVNGVKWNHSRHGQTGCFSQYDVIPKANNSPINIGTMAGDAWFQGAIGKVAIYDFLLSQTQITSHYRTMTGQSPTGSCQDTCSF